MRETERERARAREGEGESESEREIYIANYGTIKVIVRSMQVLPLNHRVTPIYYYYLYLAKCSR